MNKNNLIQKYFNKADQLTLKNQTYQKLVHDLIVWLLDNDKVNDDITSNLLFDKPKTINAQIIAKQNLVVSGLEETEYLLQKFTNLKYSIMRKDGNEIEEKKVIIKLEGDAREILTYERVILNILQRLSGIATETKAIIKKIKNEKPYIAATRKTYWGLLDKKAVAMGGGFTHRLNLSDGILIKDNHFLFPKIIDALQKLSYEVNNTLIEVEVEDERDLLELINFFSKKQTDNTLAILLDNFPSQKVKQLFKKNKLPNNIIFEASGGITKENFSKWVDTGVDIISLGSLTHSSQAADISLEVIK